MIHGKNFLNQLVKNNLKTKNAWKDLKKTMGRGDDYTTGCLLDYPYFKENYNLLAIDLGKQQAPDADPKRMQQINFTGNLEHGESTTMFLILKEVQETVLDFPQEPWEYCK